MLHVACHMYIYILFCLAPLRMLLQIATNRRFFAFCRDPIDGTHWTNIWGWNFIDAILVLVPFVPSIPGPLYLCFFIHIYIYMIYIYIYMIYIYTWYIYIYMIYIYTWYIYIYAYTHIYTYIGCWAPRIFFVVVFFLRSRNLSHVVKSSLHRMMYNGNASIQQRENLQARKLYIYNIYMGMKLSWSAEVKPTSAEAPAEAEADLLIAEGPLKQGLFNLQYSWTSFRRSSTDTESTYQ